MPAARFASFISAIGEFSCLLRRTPLVIDGSKLDWFVQVSDHRAELAKENRSWLRRSGAG